jgi:hypothetical protein
MVSCALIDAGYRGLHEPHDAFWGARYARDERRAVREEP